MVHVCSVHDHDDHYQPNSAIQTCMTCIDVTWTMKKKNRCAQIIINATNKLAENNHCV